MDAKKKTSEKILDTAFDCLAENGYANVSMRDIAKASGTALSQLTYHFKTKEKLFLAVIDRMMRQYLCEVKALMRTKGSAKKKLGALAAYFKNLAKENPKMLRLFIDLSAQAIWIPSFRKKMNSLNADLAKMIDTEIIGTKADTEEMQVRPTGKMIFGALYGASLQALLESDGTDTEADAMGMFDLAESLL